jgi:hypothetical protein
LTRRYAQSLVAEEEVLLFLTHLWLTISELVNMLLGMESFWFIFGLLAGALAVLWLDEWFSRPRIKAPTLLVAPTEGLLFGA